jgi:O-succinylbenzoic acid--CoA ligase
MMQSARITCDFLKIREGSTALLCMPVEYIAGRMMIVRSMVCSLNLIIAEPKSMPEIDGLPAIDFAAMVPLQILNLIICRKPFENIRKLLIGGAEISPELENLLLKLPTEAYATYGMAESCSHIALRRLNPARENEYHTLPGVVIAADERGCLVIEASWLPKRIITNDLVELKDKGSFRWLGRHDNLINSGGVKIVPEEVERLVALNTGRECVALGISDPKFGQKLVLVLEQNQNTDNPDELKNNLNSILPRHWKCKELRFVTKFPRNDAFKVDRKALIEMI